jgi:uncharacterized protein (DUF2237 family)|tara:strand:- start:355 stop:732 length:378 start_codon:yes stop_codon:yes gene_type:complete
MTPVNTTLNVLGKSLENCSCNPMTGYLRDGFCNTTPDDFGTHVVCAVVNKEFLEFSFSKGNDLMTPIPHWNFPGLKPGDKWCLCVSRWKQAEKANAAPLVDLKATHELALKYVSLALLEKYAVPF